MTEISIAEIEVANIRPSPFQHRQVFDDASLRELAKSIAVDGLLQPITVRPVNAHFELIAGERRWRSIQQFTDLKTVPARILEVTDLQARRLCATENLQRSDLTALEEIMALAELVDASLMESFREEYTSLSAVQEPRWRVKTLLMKLESDRKNGTDYFSHKFMAKIQEIFSGLPKPKDVRSFEGNDLPLLFTHDEVQQFALNHRLNKSQTKAVSQLQEEAPEVFRDIAQATPKQAAATILNLSQDCSVFADASAGEEFNEVRDLSAETIRKAVREIKAEKQRQECASQLWSEPNAKDSIDLDALWLWGRLVDFLEMKIARRPFNDLIALMTPTMQSDVSLIAPQLASYLTGTPHE